MRILGEIRALERAGWKVIVTTYHLGKDTPGLDIRRIVRIPWYNKLEAGPSWHKFYLDFLLLFLSLKTFLRERPALIHGHLHEGAFIGGLVKYLTFGGAPVVFDVQGSLTGELETFSFFKKKPLLRKIFWAAEKMICSMSDFFVCSSESNADFIRNVMGEPAEKVRTVVDGVHTDFFRVAGAGDLRRELGLEDEKKIVTFTGALLAGKGIDNLLKAMPLVLRRVPDAFFLIVGYPVEDARAEVERLGLDKRTFFTGRVDYFELPKYLDLAQVAVDPKEDVAGEASGKIINYMGAGLPVVCFDSLNNRNFLAEGGTFAENGSVASLADGIVRLLRDPEERLHLGEMNARRVGEVFSWDSSIREVLATYEELLK
jgi:glycosyltransferase involved in cell wall biosynthesis